MRNRCGQAWPSAGQVEKTTRNVITCGARGSVAHGTLVVRRYQTCGTLVLLLSAVLVLYLHSVRGSPARRYTKK